jgi:hypothetical protein
LGLPLGENGLVLKTLGLKEENAISWAAAGCGDIRNPSKKSGFPNRPISLDTDALIVLE